MENCLFLAKYGILDKSYSLLISWHHNLLSFLSADAYSSTQERLTKAWRDALPQLYTAQAPLSYVCFLCQKEDRNIIWCRDCGMTAYYCEECNKSIHCVAVLHVPLKWMVSSALYILFFSEIFIKKLTDKWSNICVNKIKEYVPPVLLVLCTSPYIHFPISKDADLIRNICILF